MKQKHRQDKKQELEFIELDDCEEAYEDAEEDDYEEEDEYESLAGRGMSIVPKIFIVIITIVIIISVVLITRLSGKNHEDAAEVSLPAMEEISDEDTQEEQIQELEEQENQTDQGLIVDGEESQPDMEEAENAGQEAEAASQEAADPQTETMSTQQGRAVDVTELLSSGAVVETEKITLGIDVARYQGTIDWAQVAASGIEFAMVRVGYRTDSTREICADTNAKYNMQEERNQSRRILFLHCSKYGGSGRRGGLGCRLYIPVSDYLSCGL